jgi:hypothetical protein
MSWIVIMRFAPAAQRWGRWFSWFRVRTYGARASCSYRFPSNSIEFAHYQQPFKHLITQLSHP